METLLQVTKVFLEDYESFSRLAVFLEQVMLDESQLKFEEYLRGMRFVENMTNLILCDLHIAIHSVVHATVSNYVERNVMSDSLRSMNNTAERFVRDYIIFHKAENFGKLVEEKYKLLSFRGISN